MSETPKAFRERTNKPEAYLTYCQARTNNQSIGASARAAGISRNTATRYETLRIQGIEQENRLLDVKGAILTKTEVAEQLSKALTGCEAPYKASIATSLAKVMGYEAPTRSQVEVRTVPPSVEHWMQTLTVIDINPEPAQLDASTPPKALPPKASSD